MHQQKNIVIFSIIVPDLLRPKAAILFPLQSHQYSIGHK